MEQRPVAVTRQTVEEDGGQKMSAATIPNLQRWGHVEVLQVEDFHITWDSSVGACSRVFWCVACRGAHFDVMFVLTSCAVCMFLCCVDAVRSIPPKCQKFVDWFDSLNQN